MYVCLCLCLFVCCWKVLLLLTTLWTVPSARSMPAVPIVWGSFFPTELWNNFAAHSLFSSQLSSWEVARERRDEGRCERIDGAVYAFANKEWPFTLAFSSVVFFSHCLANFLSSFPLIWPHAMRGKANRWAKWPKGQKGGNEKWRKDCVGWVFEWSSVADLVRQLTVSQCDRRVGCLCFTHLLTKQSALVPLLHLLFHFLVLDIAQSSTGRINCRLKRHSRGRQQWQQRQQQQQQRQQLNFWCQFNGFSFRIQINF